MYIYICIYIYIQQIYGHIHIYIYVYIWYVYGTNIFVIVCYMFTQICEMFLDSAMFYYVLTCFCYMFAIFFFTSVAPVLYRADQRSTNSVKKNNMLKNHTFFEKQNMSYNTKMSAAACSAVNILWGPQNVPFQKIRVFQQQQKRLRSPVQS